MKNPFIVQRPIKYEEPFCDRKKELKLLKGAALRSESVCILSIRRFGKTSLINQVLGILEEEGWITMRLDLSRCFSVESLTGELEKGLYGIADKWEKIIRGLKLVSRLRPQVSIDPASSLPAMSFDFSRPPAETDRLRNVLREIVSFPEKREPPAKICLVLDEFQNVRKIDSRGRLEWIFRSVFQDRGPNFVPFLLGSEKHLLQMMIYHESAAFFKSVTPLTLPPLPEPEVVSFVGEQFQTTLNTRIPASRVRNIYRLFGGHPYVINWFWAELWTLEQRAERDEPLDTWVEIATRIILNQRDYYEALNSRLPLGARKVLTKIVSNEPVKKVFSKEFMVGACGMSQGSLQSAIKILTEEDKIRKTPDGMVLNDPLERLIITISSLEERELAEFVRARIAA